MTIAYYKGKRYKAEPKSKTKPKTKPISDDVINQDEVEHNQLQNKIMDDKINNAYFSTVEKLNKVTGLIVEGAMRKHKQEEELWEVLLT